ncbi:MAG: hypothetical protein ACYC6F_03635 [Longimicrobiales bacterium]
MLLSSLHARAATRAALVHVGCALLLAGACASTEDNPYPSAAFSDGISLEVENQHWTDMLVSVRCCSVRQRLGVVPSNTRATFVLPRTLSASGAEVCFEADPIGSDEVYESPSVLLTGSETYVWTLAVYIDQSMLAVR